VKATAVKRQKKGALKGIKKKREKNLNESKVVLKPLLNEEA